MHDGPLTRLRRDRFTLMLGACAATGALLVLARELNFGVALHADSVIFISVARSLLAGDGFMQIVHGPLANWPPLYPLLLAAATFFTFDPHEVAGPVNAIIFALTVLVVGLWLRQRLASRFLALWACLATMLAFPLVQQASWAMTEPLFVLVITLSLMHMDKFIREGRRPSLLWAAAFAALACLTRHMGIALAAASVLLLALQPGVAPLRKARRITLYSLIALTPVCLWMTRNFVLVGHIIGKQPSITYSIPLAEFLHGTLAILATWLHPEWIAGHASFAAETALLTLCIALALTTAYLITRAQPNWHGFTVCGAFALTYLAALAAALTGISWSFMNPRYLTPVYIPLLLMAVFAADNFLRRSPANGWKAALQRTSRLGLLGALGVWVGHSATLQAGQIRQAWSDAPVRSLSHSKWTNSKTIQYIQDASIDGPIYSNEVLPLYIHNDPTKTYRYLRPREDDLRRLLETAEGDAYIVWFYDRWWAGGKFYYSDLHLRSLPSAEVAADFSDGLVLRLRLNRRFDEAAYRTNKAKRANEIINAAGPVAISARFNVHIDQNALTYIKDSCTEADTAETFLLHVAPKSENDLHVRHQRYKYNNLDFQFDSRGFRLAEKCAARIGLPEYPIAHIKTGQFATGKGKIWMGEIVFH